MSDELLMEEDLDKRTERYRGHPDRKEGDNIKQSRAKLFNDSKFRAAEIHGGREVGWRKISLLFCGLWTDANS